MSDCEGYYCLADECGGVHSALLGVVEETDDNFLFLYQKLQNDDISLYKKLKLNSLNRRNKMLHDVVDAIYRGGYKIEIVFDDGKRGVVDFSGYVEKGGVFERFKDREYFRRFKINEGIGTLTWSDEVDIAPETLYAEATGSGLPPWMKSDEEMIEKGRRVKHRSVVGHVSRSRRGGKRGTG
jgi:hypothetical protein